MADKPGEDAERVKRMQALQMADLGTARREYISTSDLPNKLHRVTQAQVEAQRASNIPGSESHRLAEANQSQLSAWNEAWKTIGGDIEMEELDSMMNGQTHRAQLTKLIMEKSGHKSKLMESLTASSRGRKAVRAGLMHGRGGGMVGAKVRKPAVPATKAPASKSKAKAGSPIPLPRKPEPLPPVKSFKDPAKDCNNIPSSGSNKRGCPYLGKTRASVVKTRRPVPAANNVNFETLLADSSTFLAAIPGMASGSSPKQAQKDTEIANNVETGNVNPPEQSPATGHTAEPETTPEVSKAEPRRPDMKIHVFTSLSASGLNKATDSVTQKIDHGFGTCLPQPRLRNPTPKGSGYNQLIPSLEAKKRDEVSGSGKINETELLADEMDLLDMNDEPNESEPLVVKPPPAQLDAENAPVAKLPEALPETKKPPVKSSDPAQELEKILQILACPSALTPFAVDYFEWRKTQLMEEIISIGASATPVVQKEKGNLDIIDLGTGNAATQSSRTLAPIPPEHTKEQEEPTLISIESESESEYETAGGDADDEADDKSDIEPIGGETDVSSSGKGAFAKNSRDMEDIAIEAEDSTVGLISNANWELSNKSLIGESAVSREVKKAQLPKGVEGENLIGSRWLPGRTGNFDVQQAQTKKSEALKAPFTIKKDADAPAAGAVKRKEPHTAPTPVPTGPLVTVQAPIAPAQKLPTPATSVPMAPARAIPEPIIPPPIIRQAPTTKVELPRRSKLPMREVPNFPISAATMQYFSSVATQGNSLISDENTNPSSGNANPQIHTRKTSGSSPLSPAAPTFCPNLASRSKTNNIEISRKGTSGRQSSQHSQLSSPSPKANTQASEQISKSIFVIEMEKRGIKVNFANYYEESQLRKS